ncbi:MAG: cell envelope protein SmpA [Kordiimonas sp.]|nr:cell envelope protein SmpA [Kordiimonas sp.]|tara:strand:- start:3543 stop:4022 length:480 start_codon:yes stop_codon:yes gene_type:complete
MITLAELRTTLTIITLTIVSAIVLTSCSPRTYVRGYQADTALIEAIRPGVDNRNSVQSMLGSPTATATFDYNSWYYYSKKSEQFAFFDEKIVEQNIIAVRFNDDGYVIAVDRFTAKDGKIINPVTKKTITHGRELGFFQELFGNIGRFSAGGGVPEAGN